MAVFLEKGQPHGDSCAQESSRMEATETRVLAGRVLGRKDARFHLGSDRQQPLGMRAWMALGSCGLT